VKAVSKPREDNRRAKLWRMLAAIEQQIQEAELLASCTFLGADEREFASVLRDDRRRVAKRVEMMLAKAQN